MTAKTTAGTTRSICDNLDEMHKKRYKEVSKERNDPLETFYVSIT